MCHIPSYMAPVHSHPHRLPLRAPLTTSQGEVRTVPLSKLLDAEGIDRISGIIGMASDAHITDIHISTDSLIKCRVAGAIVPFSAQGEHIRVAESDMLELLGKLGFSAGVSSMIMYRERGFSQQLRCLYLANDSGHHLKLRILPYSPQPISETLHIDQWLDADRRASDNRGLILITGALGSGKTTLAASLVETLAMTGRHMLTIEDPIEYILPSSDDIGAITQLECDIHGSRPHSTMLSFTQALQFAYRADHNGLFVSECRRPEIFHAVAELSTTHVPVITTLHAGDIADAIIRVVSMLAQTLGGDVARTLLRQGLHSVWHTSMAYSTLNEPIPVVACLPLHQRNKYQTRIWTEYDPGTIRDIVANALVAAKDLPDAITYDRAIATAQTRGATEASLDVVRRNVRDFLQA